MFYCNVSFWTLQIVAAAHTVTYSHYFTAGSPGDLVHVCRTQFVGLPGYYRTLGIADIKFLFEQALNSSLNHKRGTVATVYCLVARKC